MQTNKLTYVEMNYKKVQASYHVLLCNLGFYDWFMQLLSFLRV